MTNGLIYIIVKFAFDNLRFLTVVELFKLVGHLMNPKKNVAKSKLAYSRTSVDIFILLKWILVIVLISYKADGWLCKIAVWYLVMTNVYSYFYYHIWCDESLNSEKFKKDRVRRRFVNLILAVGYSELCFSYLYSVPYKKEFEWSHEIITYTKSMWFSVSNSLAANYEEVKPLSSLGNNIAMTQLVVTVVFLTIILSKSIPQTTSRT